LEKCNDSYEEDEDVGYKENISKAEKNEQSRVMRNKSNILTSEQEQIIDLEVQIAWINSIKIKKKYSTKHKKMDKKSKVRYICKTKNKFYR
jgi:hypothetical protein